MLILTHGTTCLHILCIHYNGFLKEKSKIKYSVPLYLVIPVSRMWVWTAHNGLHCTSSDQMLQTWLHLAHITIKLTLWCCCVVFQMEYQNKQQNADVSNSMLSQLMADPPCGCQSGHMDTFQNVMVVYRGNRSWKSWYLLMN